MTWCAGEQQFTCTVFIIHLINQPSRVLHEARFRPINDESSPDFGKHGTFTAAGTLSLRSLPQIAFAFDFRMTKLGANPLGQKGCDVVVL
jgi:hypothetical protein